MLHDVLLHVVVNKDDEATLFIRIDDVISIKNLIVPVMRNAVTG